jgi:hypothetical protein
MNINLFNDKKYLLIICICIIILACTTNVYADSEYNSKDLETIDNGTVSGGLYSDSYLGYDENNVNINYSSTYKKDKSTSSNNNKNVTNMDDSTIPGTSYNNHENNVETKFDDRNVTYI